MKAIWQNKTIAESDDTVVVENNHYFPSDSLDKLFIEASDHTSICPWKGTAHYYHVVVDGQRNDNAAWFYPQPKEAASNIKDRVAFWKGVSVSS